MDNILTNINILNLQKNIKDFEYEHKRVYALQMIKFKIEENKYFKDQLEVNSQFIENIKDNINKYEYESKKNQANHNINFKIEENKYLKEQIESNMKFIEKIKNENLDIWTSLHTPT